MLGKVICISNAKGGVGKTTTTFNFGAALANRGKRVLLVDNDQQGSLTKAMGHSPDQLTSTLTNLMFTIIDSPNDFSACLSRTLLKGQGLDLIPANKKLAGMSTRLIVMQTSQPVFGEETDMKSEHVLHRIVEQLRPLYDYILIDCGPKPDLQMINALVAADSVIIPVQAHYLDAEGLPDTLEIIRKVQRAFNPGLSISGILLTMYHGRTLLSRAVYDDIREQYSADIPVFAHPIEYSVKVAEHPIYGESIFSHAPNSAPAQSYSEMAEEVLRNG